MRDRTIVFIGDSHDRQNLEIVCACVHSTGAVLSVPHYHIKAHCRLPNLNLTLAQWFHFGLAPESDSVPPNAWNVPSIPTSHEN
ncbi:esterase, SGNH hydrolase-type domain protein [Rhodotorula toruloides]|uniref:Esterase, SGNH hydrolase-type domain protein n=1 Tax=Rhodotorula toruloides TaxID=5286 RepID=A0A511KQ35_RHOTO|nr:esterase, SGNH hydrolase-type domain protein [Rhodotorula toruloides]